MLKARRVLVSKDYDLEASFLKRDLIFGDKFEVPTSVRFLFSFGVVYFETGISKKPSSLFSRPTVFLGESF